MPRIDSTVLYTLMSILTKQLYLFFVIPIWLMAMIWSTAEIYCQHRTNGLSSLIHWVHNWTEVYNRYTGRSVGGLPVFRQTSKGSLICVGMYILFSLGITTSSFLEKSVQISSQRLPLIWRKVNVATSEKVSVKC